jgi:hemolysin III
VNSPVADPREAHKPDTRQLPFQTIGEEIANATLHGMGVLFAVAGLVLLTLRANGQIGGSGGGGLARAGYILYTATMITMFLASTLYHAMQHKGAKRVFRVLDHSAIYLLIAGTYTPFCLVALRGAWGWTFLGIEWALALAGIVLYAVNWKFIKKAELAIYILMGWAIVAGWAPMKAALPRAGLVLLMAGGLAYTLGTFFYSRKKWHGAHVTWHVFVLAGAILHWCSIWLMSRSGAVTL